MMTLVAVFGCFQSQYLIFLATPVLQQQVMVEWCWLFPRVRGFWVECSTIHSPPALFFFFFFKVEISSHTLIPVFRPGSVHSGWVFPDELRVSSFPDRFPHTALWHSWWPSDVAKHCVCFSSYTCTSTTGNSNACWHTFQSSGTARVRVCFTPKHTPVP